MQIQINEEANFFASKPAEESVKVSQGRGSENISGSSLLPAHWDFIPRSRPNFDFFLRRFVSFLALVVVEVDCERRRGDRHVHEQRV